jgi:predicted CXXCH cytochrome family protein
MRWPRCATTLLLSGFLNAQDIDTLISSGDRKPFTFLDQIEDVQERQAFQALHRTRDAGKRKLAADRFLESYPQSWLLPFVHEIAGKSRIDLGDRQGAIAHARKSLRLYPENPLLLLPLANIHLERQEFREAATNAREAISMIERFDRPATIEPRDWRKLRVDLLFTAHSTAGRAALSLALPDHGGSADKRLTSEAAFHLQSAAVLKPDDAEIKGLLGLFKTLAPLPALPKSERQPEYAGSAACRPCHNRQHETWRHTGMSKMLRSYSADHVFADFTAPSPADSVRPTLVKGRHNFEVRTGRGEWRQLPVTHIIGSKWQQAFATRTEDGRIHVFPIQYSRIEKAWVNYWRQIDPPNSRRADPANFHQLSGDTDYLVNCAPCHTSQLKNTADGLVYREEGVNCEMCHGPSLDHVRDMKAGARRSKLPIDPPVNFRNISSRDYIAICAQCHAQSRLNEPGASGEINYRESGADFFARYPARPLAEFSRRAFYKDGRLRETTFIVEAVLRSRCYKVGAMNCGHCHDPHPDDAATNPTGLKFRNDPDRLCTQCHKSHATGHRATSEGSRCLNCHMPKIMNSVLFTARSHQTDDIPGREFTALFGQAESPNACLMCHKDKDTSWLPRSKSGGS